MNQNTTPSNTLSAIVSTLLLASLSAHGAGANKPVTAIRDEPVAYRCHMQSGTSSKDGAQVIYQSMPCDQGTALHASDQRTESQRAASSKAHQSETKLARQLERERLKSERQSASKPAMSLSPEPKMVKTRTAKGKSAKKVQPFTAKAPKSPNTPAHGRHTPRGSLAAPI